VKDDPCVNLDREKKRRRNKEGANRSGSGEKRGVAPKQLLQKTTASVFSYLGNGG